MSTTPPVVILFGRPGAGKGSLAAALAARHGFVACSTGQAMRDWSRGPRPEQRALAAALARGEYGSDALAAQIVGEFLAGLPAATPGVILDGFPRNTAQLDAFAALAIPATAVLVNADEITCRERIARRGYCPADGATRIGPGPCPTCGVPTTVRPEDADPDALVRRFDAYDDLVTPVIMAWERRGLPLLELRNEGDPDELNDAADWVAEWVADAAAA